ncbi:hypothetical protein L1049_010921 [Liquidambar formosana]|uniref:NAC domain-containing protein n=1 Tax=Liquidambar formosana TaxID=63359 RepID=A0AAP0WZD4_LIQFO
MHSAVIFPPNVIMVTAQVSVVIVVHLKYPPREFFLSQTMSITLSRFGFFGDDWSCDLWHLDKSRLKSRDLEWFFFTARDRKYSNGARTNRATNKGYWKATGNDRSIQHNSRVVGMKKTLVFYKGRAPDGKRTNWVTHEYRLVNEEYEKAGVLPNMDGYVLCRVFQKSGLGPPNEKLSVPFLEGEWDKWDDDQSVLVPGAETADEVVGGDDANLEGNAHDRDTQFNKSPVSQSEHSKDSHNAPFVCKIERQEDGPLQSMEDPRPQINLNKRLRHNDTDSENSTTTATATQDPCSSITTTAAVAAAATKTNFPSALLEFPLLESIEPKESPPVPVRRFDFAALDISVPPGYLEFIKTLQKEIHNISMEKETLKIQLMSAQAMLNILHSRIEFLTKENEDLKRSVQNVK